MAVSVRTLVFVLAVSSSARAEIDLANVEDVEDLSLADLLERPIVTASRYAQKPASSPLLVSSVDADQITAFGYRTLGDALSSMRGVYLSNDRNYSYIGARGFAVPGDYNTRFALSIDGHRINDAVYGQATPGLELGLPLIAIDRVEMMRGGAWSVYGQNALLGAINVVTATGESRPGLRVVATTNATAETYGDPAGRPAVAPRAQDVSTSYGAVARDYDLFVAANYQYDPGLTALYMPDLASDELACVDRNGFPKTCDGIVEGGDAEEVGSSYLAVRSKHFTFFSLASRRRKLAPTAAWSTIVGDPIQTHDDRLYADGTYKVRAEKFDVEAHAALDYYGYYGMYPYDVPRKGYESLPASRIANQDYGSGVWATGEVRGRYKWARLGRHLTDVEVAAGAETQWQNGRQLNYDPAPEGTETYVDRSDSARMVAATAHATARAFDHVVGFAAVRTDYYPEAFGLTTNPQLGFVLDFGEAFRLRGSMSRGMRAPNLYELHFQSDGQLAPTNLGPEHSLTRAVSVERYLGTNVRMLAVGYSQEITDLIALTTNGDGLLTFVNEGRSRGYGLELELEGRWERLQLRSSYALQHSRAENDEPRVNSPRSLAVASAIVPVGTRAQLGFETHYVGSRLTLAGTTIEPVFLSTASLMVRDITSGVDLAFGVRNVFDARTASPGSEEHVQAQIPSDPRTFWISLTARVGGALLP